MTILCIFMIPLQKKRCQYDDIMMIEKYTPKVSNFWGVCQYFLFFINGLTEKCQNWHMGGIVNG